MLFVRKLLKIAFSIFMLVYSSLGLSREVKFETLNVNDVDYKEIRDEFKEQGVVTRILSAETSGGYYFFVFVEKSIRKEEIRGDVTTFYGVKPNGEWGEVKIRKDDDVTYEMKNLRAYILLADHGGYDRIQKFQDDGNEVYWPYFLYDDCYIKDADGDGHPEFYLTYFGQSDGLDSKPLKVIVYDSNQNEGEEFLKAKATAWYPAGNEDAQYNVDYDAAWLSLPDAIKKTTKTILNKNRYNKHLN